MTDHDQILKSVLQASLPGFFRLFLPDLEPLFDFSDVTWLAEEVFVDPPTGSRRRLDLIAQVRLREPMTDAMTGDQAEHLVAAIHVEIEGRDSLQVFRPRMCRYFFLLSEKLGLPVLPIAVFLHRKMAGVGEDAFVMRFGARRPLRFEYVYVALPGLSAADYLDRGEALAAGLAGLMQIPDGQRVQIKGQSLMRLAESALDDQHKYLLGECLDTYLTLNQQEDQALQETLTSKPFRKAKQMTTTWEARGIAKGEARGIAKGQRDLVLSLLSDRFGRVTQRIRRKLESLTAEELRELATRIYRVDSIDDLNLL